jgi:hypothetical protein
MEKGGKISLDGVSGVTSIVCDSEHPLQTESSICTLWTEIGT